MTMRLDSRQSRQRSVLDQLSNSTDLRLDVILNLINDELTMPLRMRADSTPSRNLNIGAIEVQTIDGSDGTGRKRTIQPISNLLPSFTAGYMTFPAASGGSITATGFAFQSAYTLTVTLEDVHGNHVSGNYIKVMIALSSLGQVVLSFGTEGASEAAATLPVALSGTLALGYVVLQNVGGVIQNVTDSNIRQFSGGGGGGGSGASAKQVTFNSHGFKVGNVVYLNGSTYALAQANASNTAEAIGVISNVVTVNIFEVTELGYLSGVDTTNTVEGGAALTAGTVYFLSASTAGKLTATEPTTIGYVSKPMLIADGASSGYALNYRGSVLGGTNARTQLNLASSSPTAIFNAASPSLYTAGELTGWVQLGTSQKFYFQAPFAQNGGSTDWNISPSYVGDTPPAGFSITMASSGVVTMTCPTFTGTGLVNYALNAPAVGATFPLAVDAVSLTTGTVAAARLPAATSSSAGTLSYYQEDDVTLLGVRWGFTTPTSVFNVKLTRIGRCVTITFPSKYDGTSSGNAASVPMSVNIPTAFRPNYTSFTPVVVVSSNSSVTNCGGIELLITGEARLYYSTGAVTWPNLSNSGCLGFSVTFTI